MQRNSQIDVARGIGSLLVVFGHCFYSLSAPLNKFILSFHMPLFFFLSGLTVQPEVKRGGVELLWKESTNHSIAPIDIRSYRLAL